MANTRKPLLNRREWIITIVTVLVCLGLLIFQPPCLVKTLLHIPCPACGMTRAWLAALRLDLAGAFSAHPMFWSVPILYLYVLKFCRVFPNPRVNWTVLGLILAGFLVSYIHTLAVFCRNI